MSGNFKKIEFANPGNSGLYENSKHDNPGKSRNIPEYGKSEYTKHSFGKFLDFPGINHRALSRFPDFLARWLPDGRRYGDEWVALNPTRNDRKPGSFKINMRTGVWADFAKAAALPTSPQAPQQQQDVINRILAA